MDEVPEADMRLDGFGLRLALGEEIRMERCEAGDTDRMSEFCQLVIREDGSGKGWQT